MLKEAYEKDLIVEVSQSTSLYFGIIVRDQPGIKHNSEYPAALRSAQIGSRWSPTSGTRGTLNVMPDAVGVSNHPWFDEVKEKKKETNVSCIKYAVLCTHDKTGE